MINFSDHFLFSIFVCALKYVNMTRISNISFFRFCWKMENQIGRSVHGPEIFCYFLFSCYCQKSEKNKIISDSHFCRLRRSCYNWIQSSVDLMAKYITVSSAKIRTLDSRTGGSRLFRPRIKQDLKRSPVGLPMTLELDQTLPLQELPVVSYLTESFLTKLRQGF